jgi:hypothetical protein
MEGFLFENVSIFFGLWKKLLPINKWVKKRRIHTGIKITDYQMNWEMEKCCWQIDEKAVRRLPAWGQ